MKCSPGKIINPKTGRCVLKTGAIGKKILQEQCNSRQKILNPSTGRCVSKSGAIGIKIMKKTPERKRKNRSRPVPKKKSKSIPKKPPNKFARITEKCQMNKVWKKNKRIGSGSVGSVYLTGEKSPYVLKIQKDDQEFRREVMILKKLVGWKHAPKIEAMWTCKGKGYIVMEKLEKIKYSKSESLKKIQQVLKQLHSKNITFPDCHSDNVMMRKDGTVVLIDFGWSEYFTTKNSKVYDNWLAHNIVRGGVTMKQMYIWENYVMMDDFGTKEQIKKAEKEMEKLKDKYN